MKEHDFMYLVKFFHSVRLIILAATEFPKMTKILEKQKKWGELGTDCVQNGTVVIS